MTAPSLTLAGMSPSTSNLGVDALLWSTLGGVARVAPETPLDVIDYGQGERPSAFAVGDTHLDVRLVPANVSLRVHQPWSLYRMAAETAIRRPIAAGTHALWNAAALLDVSGGDSFTDLYGGRRFRLMSLPKLIAQRVGTPVHLLPQTYGPFEGRATRRVAERIVERAASAWSRDPDSHAALLELAGDRVDPDRLHEGVDLAFALSPEKPVDLPADLATALDSERAIGVNISGLCYNDAESAAAFGFRLDYHRTVDLMVDWLLENHDGPVVLVSHVGTVQGPESDLAASRAIANDRPQARADGRLVVAPLGFSVAEMKWLLARFAWFVGTRMHATIGAMSSGVPTATLAYSLKARGVFETAGAAGAVADARRVSDDDALRIISDAYRGRDAERERLRSAIPSLVDRATHQIDSIVTAALTPHE